MVCGTIYHFEIISFHGAAVSLSKPNYKVLFAAECGNEYGAAGSVK